MTSRRQFLAGGAAVSLLTRAGRAATYTESAFPFSEFETRIASRDFRDITKDVLPTPCLIVDQSLFERNLKTMQDVTKANGIAILRSSFGFTSHIRNFEKNAEI